jgi:uncharacterized membrane protein
MNTKILMTTNALTLLTVGLILTFLPDEILKYCDLENTGLLRILLQIIGALYFGFGMLNWMSKSGIIGGIYNRPIAVANFTHFFIAGLALIKGIMADPGLPKTLWIVSCIYLIFAISFGIVLFRHPLTEKKL